MCSWMGIAQAADVHLQFSLRLRGLAEAQKGCILDSNSSSPEKVYQSRWYEVAKDQRWTASSKWCRGWPGRDLKFVVNWL